MLMHVKQYCRFYLLLDDSSLHRRTGLVNAHRCRRCVCLLCLQMSPNLIAVTELKPTVYHWASVTAGKHGRVCGFFAGWWNFLGWLLALASICQIVGALLVSMYGAFHPEFEALQWHVFVAFLATTWISCAIVLLANRLMPMIEGLGGFFTIAGVFITVIVCAAMPTVNGKGHASNSFVWHDWVNKTGYSSDGFAFLLGMLNGAFTVGTPDITSHLAEEIPKYVPRSVSSPLFFNNGGPTPLD